MKNTVILRRCEEYDRATIERIVSEGMDQLGYKPAGRVFAKPNVVFAYKTESLGENAYTHPAVVGGSLAALSKVPGITRIDVGENVAVGTPTRLCYEHAGYYDEMKALRQAAGCPVDLFCIDEALRKSVFVGGVVHDNLRIARKMAAADTMVYLPKLKGHCVSNMTGAVKLNIGICSDDERSIRHDFMLNEKIVDLLSVGWPDFIVMDAVDVGVGNEAFPGIRKLGLIIMGVNPVAVDLVAARLLGFSLEDIPYLKVAVERGYQPASIESVILSGDLTSLEEIDAQARRILPYDDEYTKWQDVSKELRRMNSPMRFKWGPYRGGGDAKCLTGCVMGIKMFLGLLEQYAGAAAFAKADPVVFVVGKVDEPIDAGGALVFLIGSCAKATVNNAKKVIQIDKCFTTASDMTMQIGHKLGMPSPMRDPAFLVPYVKSICLAFFKKIINLRYLQDFYHFCTKKLIRRI